MWSKIWIELNTRTNKSGATFITIEAAIILVQIVQYESSIFSMYVKHRASDIGSYNALIELFRDYPSIQEQIKKRNKPQGR